MNECVETCDYDGKGEGIYPADYVSTIEFSEGLHLPMEFAGFCAYGTVDNESKNIEQCYFGVLIMEKGITLTDILKERKLTEQEIREFFVKGSRLNLEAKALGRVFLDQSSDNVLMVNGKLFVCI